jgi:hypothetical protein
VSDWTWEYLPDADAVVAGLPPAVIDEVEEIARELAVVNSLVYLDGVSYQGLGPGTRDVARARLMVRYLTDVRSEVIFIVRVTYAG